MNFDVLVLSLIHGIVLAEIVTRTFGGTWCRNQLRKTGGVLQAFRDTDGDDARQDLLLRSGKDVMRFGFVMLALLMLLFIIAYFVPWWLEWSEAKQIVYFVAVSIVSTARLFVLKKHSRSQCTLIVSSSSVRQGHGYSLIDRWLHWLALEPNVVRCLAFDLERQFALPNRAKSVEAKLNKMADPAAGAVYVCGLARSGTTMLLHILDQVDVFKSLTYRDMPFVLAPNLWKQLSRHARQESVLAERAHVDGIYVDFDSPEGFEEVFWRTFGKPTSDRTSPNFLCTI